MNKIQ